MCVSCVCESERTNQHHAARALVVFDRCLFRFGNKFSNNQDTSVKDERLCARERESESERETERSRERLELCTVLCDSV